MDSILPIGSVVLLKGGSKRIMICGRFQKDIKTGKSYNYSACLYPEGLINSKELFLFNHEDIDKIYFIGFQDSDEFAFLDYAKKESKKASKKKSK